MEELQAILDLMPSRLDRRRTSTDVRKYDLPRLQALHNEIIRLRLAGFKQVDIASTLGCTAAVVSYTLNSTLGKNKLATMSSMRDDDAVEFSARIEEMLPKCLEIYEDILEDPAIDIKLRKATADTIVKDIAGRAAPKQINAQHLHAHMTSDDITKLKQRALGAAKDAGIVIEVEDAA